jgi:SAM-dependent methyltransferase
MFRRAIVKAENYWWERRLRVDTRGIAGAGTDEHQYYATLSYRALFRILRLADLQPDDVFVDLGCGKGRVLCCAAISNVARVIGVDDVPELCGVARRNVLAMAQPHAPVEVVQGRAEALDYRQASVLFMFNPFGPETIGQVVRKLGLSAAGRSVKLIYANPVHDDALAGTSWLERYLSVRPRRLLEPKLEVSFWRSKAEPAKLNRLSD